jgi:hypothetical protein
MSSSSLKRRVFPSSKPPDGGYPPPFRLLVGGTQLHGSWYLSAIVRLQGFSSGSLVAPFRRWPPKTVTSSSWMGRGRPGCDPALSIGCVRHPRWGGGRGEPGLYLACGSANHLLFQLLVVAIVLPRCDGVVLQSCRGRRTVVVQLFGFDGLFASLEWDREQEPSGDCVLLGPWLPLQRSSPRRPEVARTLGDGTGVPFVMAPWMPVFLSIVAVEAWTCM